MPSWQYIAIVARCQERGLRDEKISAWRADGPDVIHRHGIAGGAYFLRKPLDVVVLLELLDKALWSRRLCTVQ